MNKTSAWCLLLIAGMAASYGLLQEGPIETEEGATGSLDSALLSVELSAITNLQFSRGGQRIDFNRVGGQWSATGSGGGSAMLNAEREQRLSAHLKKFVAARVERRFSVDGQALESFGLMSPVLELNVFTDQSELPTLLLAAGKRTPDGFGQFVALSGTREIAVIPAYQIKNLDQIIDLYEE